MAIRWEYRGRFFGSKKSGTRRVSVTADEWAQPIWYRCISSAGYSAALSGSTTMTTPGL